MKRNNRIATTLDQTDRRFITILMLMPILIPSMIWIYYGLFEVFPFGIRQRANLAYLEIITYSLPVAGIAYLLYVIYSWRYVSHHTTRGLYCYWFITPIWVGLLEFISVSCLAFITSDWSLSNLIGAPVAVAIITVIVGYFYILFFITIFKLRQLFKQL